METCEYHLILLSLALIWRHAMITQLSIQHVLSHLTCRHTEDLHNQCGRQDEQLLLSANPVSQNLFISFGQAR
jgi:hypothetical protein